MVISGVIRPPPEIRVVADRTALYVAKNGRTFESRILGSEKGKTPKFAFLHSTSPFHAYYEERIKFYENGGEDEKEEKQEQKKEETKEEKPVEEKRLKEKVQKASAVDPVAKAVLTARSKIAKLRSAQDESYQGGGGGDGDGDIKKSAAVTIPPPAPLHFVNIVAPSSLSIAQIETIQLVAQYAALDGKGGPFLSKLSHREWNNPSFSFLQPRHGHFAYFSALVDAYRRVIELSIADATKDGIEEMANNVDRCLEIAAYRAEYERDAEEQARKRDETHEAALAARIDWHDFVVAETIDFPADEVVELNMLPPPPPQVLDQRQAGVVFGEGGEEMLESDEEGEQIRVVPSYKPKIVASHENKLETVIDPISGKAIPIKDLPEHMRIQLLDPKWAEERKKFQDKQKDSNLVSGDVVASYLEQFAQARGDRFGKTEQDLLSKEAESQKKLEEANRVIREQAQSQSAVGPSLPRKAPPPDNAQEPTAKRQRLEAPAPSVPPPLPPPPPTTSKAPPAPAVSEEPFAVAATGATPTAAASSELLSESEFAASLSKPEVNLQIRVPNERSQMAWNFYGQIVSVSVDVMSNVKSVKKELSTAHLNGMPANKIQLKNPATGMFLKDAMTLAALNIGPNTSLELVPKTRGGKKK
jgi:splicing factor 3A subunit 1